jgi:hypothetical protein
MPVTTLRMPVLPGAYKPGAAGRCVVCGRSRYGQMCSATCRLEARRVAPRGKRVRRPEPVRPACDVADLSANTKHLIAIGKALHGKYWQRPTARDLGLDRKFVWRWSRGQGLPTTDHLERLLAVTRQRHDAIANAYLPALKHVNAYIRAQRAHQGASHLLPARNES